MIVFHHRCTSDCNSLCYKRNSEHLRRMQTVYFSSRFNVREHNLPLIGNSLPFRITLIILCIEFLKIHLPLYRNSEHICTCFYTFPIFIIFLEGMSLYLSSRYRTFATMQRVAREGRDSERRRARTPAEKEPRKSAVPVTIALKAAAREQTMKKLTESEGKGALWTSTYLIHGVQGPSSLASHRSSRL